MFLSLLCMATVVGMAAVAGKGLRTEPPAETPKEEVRINTKSYNELSEKITQLNDYKNDIDTLSDMIVDIMSCAPGKVQKTVSIKILDSDRRYDFILNGEDITSEGLIEILQNEREELSCSLRKEISKIS